MSVMSTTVAFALSQGLTLQEIETATGLDAAALGDPEARLGDHVPHLIWVALTERTAESVALTVEAARGAPFSALGGLAHGAQYAATLKDALHFINSNSRLLADRLELEFTETADELRLGAHHPNDHIDRGRVAEVGAGLMARVVKEILGVHTPPLRLEIAFEPLGPIDAYQSFFRCPILPACNRTALVFGQSVLSEPIRTADPTLFAFVQEHFHMHARHVQTRMHSPDFIRLQEALAESAQAGDYRVAAISGRAQMSTRTAQRVAAAQGTTLNKMIIDIRLAAARAMLAETSQSIESIATVLGFSDDRAFRRAFRRWTDQSPSEYRLGQT